MRYFFALLFILFAATIGNSQSVTIPDEAGRWLLEQNEKVKVYEKQVATLKIEIKSLEFQVLTCKTTIDLKVDDSKTYKTLIEDKEEQLTIKSKEIRSLQWQIVKGKIKIVLGVVVGVAAGAVVGLLITQ